MAVLPFAVLALVALPVLPALVAPVPPPDVAGYAAGYAPLALGTATPVGGSDSRCPALHTCQLLDVACEPAGTLRATLTSIAPTGPLRGMLIFFRGGGGGGWYFDSSTGTLENDLRADGFWVLQLRWHGRGWLSGPEGVQAGTAHLACWPATAITWVHENRYAPLGLDPARGVCGFCISGNSGGSTQVAFALSHYAREGILEAVLPTGGPPHAAMWRACSTVPDDMAFWYPDGTRRYLDEAWGFYDTTGPCLNHNYLFYLNWYQESVAGGGSDYDHDDTRVHLLVGANDQGMVPHSQQVRDRLLDEGSPMVAYETVPRTPHFVPSTPEGRAALRAAILAVP